MAQSKAIKQLSALTNKINELRQSRLRMQREIDEAKEYEQSLMDDLTTLLREEKLNTFATPEAQANVKRTPVPSLVDEAKFLTWAIKPANRDALKVGVDSAAWKARIAAGVKVPGVDEFMRETVTVNPVKAG